MRCTVCKTLIAAGVDQQKMIVEYVQPDGAVKTFGYLMPDGPLTAATGTLHRAFHHKHYHVVRKQNARIAAAGGLSPHAHDEPVSPLHLLAHLRYGHGIDRPAGTALDLGITLAHLHDERHAADALQAALAAREADPDHAPPGETDWRDQTVADI